MANVLGELFGDIASAIREKTGDAEKMKPAEFPEKISEIETGVDVSGVTATAPHVLEGDVFVDADGNPVNGTMKNNGAVLKKLRYSGYDEKYTYTIPEGYHDGTGIVEVECDSEQIVYPSKYRQRLYGTPIRDNDWNLTGYKFLGHVVIDPIPDKYQDVTPVTATAEDVRAGKVFVDAEGNAVEGALSGTIADVSGVTATAANVLEGKTIVDADGNEVEGSIPVVETSEVELSVQTPSGAIPVGYYANGVALSVAAKRAAVTPTKETQNLADSFYDSITVDPIPEEYQNVSGVTATAEDVVEGKVIVDAQGNEVVGTLTTGGGGGSLPVGCYWEALDIPLPAETGSRLFDFNGETYAFVSDEAATSADRYAVYKFVNDSWIQIVDFTYMDCQPAIFRYVEYNGKLHICGGFDQKTHAIFDGTNLTRLTKLPYKASGQCSFVQDGILKYFGYDKKVYVWDEDTDTWTVEATISPYSGYTDFFTINGTVYAVCNDRVYIYENKALTTIYSGSYIPDMSFGAGIAVGDFIYGYYTSTLTKNPELWRYNTKTNTFEKVCNMPGANQSTKILIKYKDTLVLNPYFSDTYTSWMAFHEVTE